MTLKYLKALALAAAGMSFAMPVMGESVSGAYLAARHAGYFNDYSKAAEYYTLALARDPSNPALLENALMAFIGLGDFDRANAIAQKMLADGIESQSANMTLTVGLARKGRFDAILQNLDEGHSIGPLVDGLVRAWAEVGQGRMSEAQQAFDKVIAAKGTKAFGLYHKGLALASVGDFEGADRIFSGEEAGPLRMTRRGVIAHAQILSQLERNDAALELFDQAFGKAIDARTSEMRAKLEAGESLPFTLVSSPEDGLAEVFYTVASALKGEAADSYTLIYSRMAETLKPDHTDALLLTASLFDALKRYDLAIETYKRVSPQDPAFVTAEMGRADALRKSGKVDASVEVLEQLAKSNPNLPTVQVTLGDTFRQTKNFAGAAKAYSRALELYGPPTKSQWFIYYARGIALERLDDWEKAEADFRQALKLQPNQPNVLNYLGYSLVEKNTKLDEALGMIQRAVAARPDDGYITDSLGWALYRLGRYKDSVSFMERAAELTPTDPIINDHLGDVYWAVKRFREARVQWQRALSFNPEEKEAKRMRRKLDVGLDAVLKAEGAKPLTVTANGG